MDAIVNAYVCICFVTWINDAYRDKKKLNKMTNVARPQLGQFQIE